MRPGTIMLGTAGPEGLVDYGFYLICSCYVVTDAGVLLVHHRGFNRWVPPGGHLEAGETFAAAAARETREETGLAVDLISAAPVVHAPDDNAVPEPAPFYVDLLREGFARPALVQYFWGRPRDPEATIEPQDAEVHGSAFFTPAELDGRPTFAQVRSLVLYAWGHHPDRLAGLVHDTADGERISARAD